ncbi:hypothetical protein [Bacterioplanes sanyensis]|nr:hypothetical protein [Bacterioplanes sanyensis]
MKKPDVLLVLAILVAIGAGVTSVSAAQRTPPSLVVSETSIR